MDFDDLDFPELDEFLESLNDPEFDLDLDLPGLDDITEPFDSSGDKS